MVRTPEPQIAVGDRVLVPWGFDEIVGEVIQMYPTGLGDRAVVRLAGDDETSGETVTVPADSLVLAAAADHPEQVDPRRYQAAIRNTLMTWLSSAMVHEQLTHGQDQVDFAVDVNGKLVLVEAKSKSTSRRVTSDDILAASGLARHGTPIVLVSNGELTRDAASRLRDLLVHQLPVYFVQWRGSEDDTALKTALMKATAK